MGDGPYRTPSEIPRAEERAQLRTAVLWTGLIAFGIGVAAGSAYVGAETGPAAAHAAPAADCPPETEFEVAPSLSECRTACGGATEVAGFARMPPRLGGGYECLCRGR